MSYDYNKNVQGVDSLVDVKMDKRTSRFLASIKELKSPRILEVGVGRGRFVKKITQHRPDLQVYGVDISSVAIKEIKKTRLSGKYFTGDVQQSRPFAPNFFDAVVIMDVLEHLEHPVNAIKEICRVLKKGGIFHSYVPC